MNSDLCFLITFIEMCHTNPIEHKIAIKFDINNLPHDAAQYPCEPETWKIIYEALPSYYKSPSMHLLKITEIGDVIIKTGEMAEMADASE